MLLENRGTSAFRQGMLFARRSFHTTRSAWKERRTHFFVARKDGKIRMTDATTAEKAIEAVEHEEILTSRPKPLGFFDVSKKSFVDPSATVKPQIIPAVIETAEGAASTTMKAAKTPASAASAETAVVPMAAEGAAKEASSVAHPSPAKPSAEPVVAAKPFAAAPSSPPPKEAFGKESMATARKAKREYQGSEVSSSSFFAGFLVGMAGLVYMKRELWEAARSLAEPMVDLDHNLRGLPTMAETEQQINADRTKERELARTVRGEMVDEALHNSAVMYNKMRRQLIESIRCLASLSFIGAVEQLEQRTGLAQKNHKGN